MVKIFYDFEFTGRGFMDIMSIGCVAMNDNLEELGTFYSLVKPKYNVIELVTKMTNITDDDLKDAKSFPEVFADFIQYVIEHKSNNLFL